MNASTLYSYMSGLGIPTGSTACLYAFTSGSGQIVFNELVSNEENFLDNNVNKLNGNVLPGIALGDENPSLGTSNGTGYFNGNDAVYIAPDFQSEDWTVFLNFSGCNFHSGDKTTIILSSANSSFPTSGFNLGINNSQRLYFEYYNPSEGINKCVHSEELNDKNLISISKLDDNLTISTHNFLDSTNPLSSFRVSGYSGCKDWCLGGFSGLGTSDPKYKYFSGYFDDFLLFSRGLTNTQTSLLSEAFFMTGYSEEGTVNVTGFRNEITGVEINFSGITGSGITGHVDTFIETVNGEDVYLRSGISGVLTGGQSTTYLTGANVAFEQTVTTGQQKLFDMDYALTYAERNVVIGKSVNASNNFELYSQNSRNTGVNLSAEWTTEASGYKLDDSFVSGTNINVYKNGYAKYSGEDYFTSGTFLIFNSSSSNTDTVIYDYATGDQVNSGWTGDLAGSNIIIPEENLLHKDVYLNEIKLIEGLNYYRDNISDQTEIDVSTLGSTGYFLFMPRVNGATVTGDMFFKIKTGSATNHFSTNFDIVSEQLWLSGLRQKENTEYFTVNAQSRLISSTFKSGFSDTIYNNEGDFLNT